MDLWPHGVQDPFGQPLRGVRLDEHTVITVTNKIRDSSYPGGHHGHA